jgi:L-fucose isomerase-like protein
VSERFGFIPVVPPFGGAGQNEEVVSAYMAKLVAMGGVRRNTDAFDDPEPLVFLMATGGTEGSLLELHARRQALVPGEPVLLLAHPGNNSLPASLEVLARLQQDGVRGRILYLRGLDDERGFAALQSALHDVAVRTALHSARIGLVGAPSDWLVASSPDAAVVTDMWGPEVVPIPLSELESAMDSADGGSVSAGATSLGTDAAETLEPSDDDLAAASRVERGLRALVDTYELDALTLRCFDIVLSRGTSGCFALSELTDSGVISGCEGDLVSTIGLMWANLLTGEVPWMANPAELDEDANTLVLAHCTVPRTLVEGYRLRSHFESGLGIGIQGTLPLGPVTLLRIGGSMLDALWVAEGEVVSTGDAENLCRTQVQVALSQGHVSELLSAPLGNHIVLVYGHHADRLATWWETML